MKKNKTLSELEKKILISLTQNGRKSFRQIAKEVGTSSTAIYNNVKKLEKSDIIKGYIPIIDLEYLGFNIISIIRLRIYHKDEYTILDKLSKYPEVSSIYSITGEWDQIIICYFKTLEDLDYFLKKKLGLPEIQRIVTHIVLKVFKDDKRTLVS